MEGRERRAAEKFFLKKVAAGADPERQRAAAKRYQSALEGCTRFEQAVKARADGKLRLPPLKRRRLFGFGLHIYGQWRRVPRENLPAAVQPMAWKMVCDGYQAADVLAMAVWSFEALGTAMTDAERAGLEQELAKAPSKPRVVQLTEEELHGRR